MGRVGQITADKSGSKQVVLSGDEEQKVKSEDTDKMEMEGV